MDLVQHLMERLRPILGLRNWDYCVLWKLSEDGRFVEWVDCCCGGSTHGVGDDQELTFSFSCKDTIFQHPRTKSCDLLAQLPSSIPFDSGIHAQTMISNEARWLNFSDNSVSSIFDVSFCPIRVSFPVTSSIEKSSIFDGIIGTKVLIPVPVGLVELFVAKQVSEDQSIIDLVSSQFNMSMEQHCNVDSSFLNMDDQNDPNDHHNFHHPPVSPATMLENLNLSSSTTAASTPMNFSQQFDNYAEGIGHDKGIFIDGSNKNEAYGFDQEIDAIQRQVMSENMNVNVVMGDGLETKGRKGGGNKDARMNRSDSLSDYSDINDEDDEPKPRRRNGKGPSKNLLAERNRRKKLNDRLYALRALVPKISKLDRASILGDAIEYVMELQRQVEDLQNELEEHSDDEVYDTNNRSTVTQQHGNGPKSALLMFSNGTHVEGSMNNVGSANQMSKQNQELESTNDDHKGQQMEPQVGVDQLEGNEFLVKVFCEHKPGGFVKLMEAFASLGLEVTNVNVTSFRCLVMNVFKVEKRDSEMVQADHVRESLLELTRHQPRVVCGHRTLLQPPPDITTTNGYENVNHGVDHHDHHQNMHQYGHHHSHLHNHQHSQLHHHPYHLHN